MPALTRGPLPARVYWRRRAAVLGTALLLVVGIARLLGGSSDGSDGVEQAVQSAAETSTSATPSGAASSSAVAPTDDATAGTAKGKNGKGKKGKKKAKPSPTQPVLAEPDGICRGSDVTVTPEVVGAVAGRPVTIRFLLRTISAEACTWQVSRNTLTVAITSGKDAIWSSRQCPGAIPAREVVVRKAATSTVEMSWSARRSDDDCSRLTAWAMPGWYHVTASALGGEPADVQFELTTPVAGTITKTATPSQSPQNPRKSPGAKPSKKPQHTPSGAVEPNA